MSDSPCTCGRPTQTLPISGRAYCPPCNQPPGRCLCDVLPPDPERDALLRRDLHADVTRLLATTRAVRAGLDREPQILDSLDRADVTRALTSAIGALRAAEQITTPKERT